MTLGLSDNGHFYTGLAGADLSAKQYFAGYVDTNGLIQLATGPNLGLMGIITEPAVSGGQSTLRLVGREKWAVVASLSPTFGDKLVPDSVGRAKAHTAPTANTSTGVITSEDVLAVSHDKGSSLAVDTLISVNLTQTKI